MTDEHIIKALGLCSSEHLGCEDGCPCGCNGLSLSQCRMAILKKAFDLINRQKAEIEELYKSLDKYILEIHSQKAEIERLHKALDEAIAESDARDIENYEIAHRVRAEAINKFAERLKNSIKISCEEAWHGDGNGIYDAEYVLNDIDNLVKELTE